MSNEPHDQRDMIPYHRTHIPAQDIPALRDPRARNNEADALTPAQQKAVVAIVEKWWSFKMASIETGKVLELSDKLDYIIAHQGLPDPSPAQVQVWRAKNPRR